MPAMHDDVWDGASQRHADGQDQRLRSVLEERDRAANGPRGRISEELRQRLSDVVAEHEHHASSRPAEGDWKPDAWDQKVHAVLAWRDRVADSVDGPLPAFGSPEWAAADERTQAAAAARHERDVASAQGVTISNRMASSSARREAQGVAEKAVAAEWARRGYSHHPLRTSTREQRAVDRELREARPKPWEDGYSASFPTDPAVPVQRQASDTRGCVQRAATAVACAAAGRAVRAAVTEPPGVRARVDDEADGHVDVQT